MANVRKILGIALLALGMILLGSMTLWYIGSDKWLDAGNSAPSIYFDYLVIIACVGFGAYLIPSQKL